MPQPAAPQLLRRGSPGVVASFAALLSLLLVVTAAACGSSSSSSGAPSDSAPPPQQGGSIVVGLGGDTDGFNPTSSQWSGSATQMARAVIDPLVVMDRDNHWQPYLAKSITPNADFTTWTFELRPGVRFHNGELLDADALVTFFRAVTDSPLASQGFPEKPTITKTGDLTVTLAFTQPWSQMPTVLSEQPGYVIAPAQLQSGDTDHPIGTGPFVFESWEPGKSLRATRNASYWQTGLPHLDSIEFRPIPDPATRQSALKAGDVDVIELNSIGQPMLDSMRSSGLRVVDDVDNVGVMNLLMNTERGALADRDVRRAIVSAIDRQAFRDTVLDPSFELADQPYPADSKWHTDVNYPAFDPEQARRVIDAYEEAHGPISITITSIAGAPTVQPEFLQQQLGAVGIDVGVQPVELATFIQQFVTGDFDAMYLGQFLYAADPDGNYPFLISKNASPQSAISLNFTRYRNDALDAALKEQRRTDDVDNRRAEFAKVWDALASDVPYAFLAYDNFVLVTDDDVYGLAGFTTPEGVALPAINHWTPFYTAAYVVPS